MVFRNRREAGNLLAKEILKRYNGKLKKPVVVAIPRGGVVVAEPIAKALNAPIELIIPRKVGAPFNEEFAIAAITEDGHILLNPSITEEVANRLGITREYLEVKAMEELQEIERRKRVYLGERTEINLEGKDLILVDDGIATGLTVKAAILSLRKKKPLRIILAIPVMPKDKVQEFFELVDDLVVLHVPEYFSAVGEFYEDFSQTSDEEVIDIIRNFKEK